MEPLDWISNPKTPSCFFAHLLQCILHCCHPPVVHCLRHPPSFRGEAPQGYSWSGRHSMYPTKKAAAKRPAKHQARHLDRTTDTAQACRNPKSNAHCWIMTCLVGTLYLYLAKFEYTDCISALLRHDTSFWFKKKLEQTESASKKLFKQNLKRSGSRLPSWILHTQTYGIGWTQRGACPSSGMRWYSMQLPYLN